MYSDIIALKLNNLGLIEDFLLGREGKAPFSLILLVLEMSPQFFFPDPPLPKQTNKQTNKQTTCQQIRSKEAAIET